MGCRLPFRIPFFRIFYSTTYTSLFFILLVLLAITPASLIYTAIAAKAYQYIIMIGGVYFLTAMCTLFVYSSRLYTNRSILAGVGKSWIPVEDGEVGRNIRKMIVGSLESSALIAWEGRPRDLGGYTRLTDGQGYELQEKSALMSADEDMLTGKIVKIDPTSPPWGRIQHPGWSSPSEADTTVQPHIHFMTVIQEIPNLIEARAVSLISSAESQRAVMAEDVVSSNLQRPANTGLRSYLNYLDSFDTVSIPASGDHFLSLYEHARFAGAPLTELQFTNLMTAFADLLAGMTITSDAQSTKSEMMEHNVDSQSVSSRPSFESSGSQNSTVHHRAPRAPPAITDTSSLPLPIPGSHMYTTLDQSPYPSPMVGYQNSMSSVLRIPQNDHDGESSGSSSIHSDRSVLRSAIQSDTV